MRPTTYLALLTVIHRALDFGRACDAKDYAAMSRVSDELKGAARRYVWAVDQIDPPTRVKQRWAERKDEGWDRAKQIQVNHW